jgi:hypothetical protein
MGAIRKGDPHAECPHLDHSGIIEVNDATMPHPSSATAALSIF